MNVSVTSPHPALRDPAWVGRVFWVSVAVVLLVPALVVTEFKPWIFVQPENLKVTARFLGDFFPPVVRDRKSVCRERVCELV